MKKPIHNENSRVKIPALVHFTRIGYNYLSLSSCAGKIDEDTNIFIDTFRHSINGINRTSLSEDEVRKIIEELQIILKSDDLGRVFYSVLLNGYKSLKLFKLFISEVLQEMRFRFN